MAGNLVVVEAKMSFEGFHEWPDAPEMVAFLRAKHRHMFVVRAAKAVNHDDRDEEFILLGRRLLQEIAGLFPTYGIALFGYANPLDLGTTSCEQLARLLVDRLGLASCSVHEDDENGAKVYAQDAPR